ncbi:MAG: antitoxin family protein [Anaerolineales bacterium]|nr:antitoxin family protein [Anaerolineales bacterium]
METITVQAVYEKGVLKPKKKLDLPEHSVVELKVNPSVRSRQTAFSSLIGVWEHLPDSEKKAIEESLASMRQQTDLKIKKLSKKK